ncbi:PhzF family phenazine biosynthesis protein [Salipiger abyssi]|uniref:PhzF family phenazine biosynthesis protein n=1 Tax=Salipiger abyssi TaxID=1250539 RepID=UPI001A8C8531|nr:PhzF family phenazine biosynthesis protein [Salipiger abyssi]MBN9890026.1 PhzF family phenazine biosynthesis protein [Salipiger abyssi]
MDLQYYVLDVFSGTALEGNPLAAVVDAGHLDTETMQRIAAEFNLSESIFLTPPEQAGSRASVRIFTRTLELPFAGHPTVGAASLIAHLDGLAVGERSRFALDEVVGTLPCLAEATAPRVAYASFGLPRLPETEPAHGSRAALAAALSLPEGDIGFGTHVPLEMSAGTPFTSVPVKDLETLARVQAREDLWVAAFGDGSHAAAFVYTALTDTETDDFRARVFAPNQGIREDPATGSASAAFTGAVARLDTLPDGAHHVVVQQGYEMGRPSRLHLDIEMSGGAVASATVGGEAVIVARGTLTI